MVSTWQNSFAQLQGFIKDNPSAEITENCISIPSDVRPEFYRLFDAVRTDFLKDNFPSSLEKGYELSRGFAKVYQEAIAASGLESIGVRASLNWFLQDPVNGLMRSLFDPLFNLIRGKLSEQAFTDSTIKLIDDTFSAYFREGYERWVVLGLMSRLQPDKNYMAFSRDFHTDSEISESSNTPGLREEVLDAIKETNKIEFSVTSISTFIVPRVLVHSQSLGRYASILTDFTEAYWRARNKSENMEWFNIKSLAEEFGRSRLWPDMLLYASDTLEDIGLIADYVWVARPDIIVEIEESDGWYERGGLELARRHIAALKPRYGCYILCRNAPPDAAYAEIMTKPASDQGSDGQVLDGSEAVVVQDTLEPDIHIITTGYDFTALDAVVEALKKGIPAG